MRFAPEHGLLRRRAGGEVSAVKYEAPKLRKVSIRRASLAP